MDNSYCRSIQVYRNVHIRFARLPVDFAVLTAYLLTILRTGHARGQRRSLPADSADPKHDPGLIPIASRRSATHIRPISANSADIAAMIRRTRRHQLLVCCSILVRAAGSSSSANWLINLTTGGAFSCTTPTARVPMAQRFDRFFLARLRRLLRIR